MDSSNVDWEKVEKDVAAFRIDIYPLEECTFGDYIGEGAAMEVFEGQCNIKMVLRDVAFKHHKGFKKSSKLKQSSVDKILEEFRHEITLMKKLKFQTNIVQIYGVTFKEKKPILIVELGNETLDKYLLEKAESGPPADWKEKIRLCLDILRGIHCLHDADIVHGDIKGENVLVFINATGFATAKLSDFGYSSSLSSKGYIGGTLSFMAPEVMGIYPELAQWQKKPAQDIFSFGLVTYQIANNGKSPYEDADDVFTIKSTDRDMGLLLAELPPDTPELFRTIITSTTKFMPIDRASTDHIEQIIWEFLTAPSLQQVNTVNPISTVKPIPKSVPSSISPITNNQISAVKPMPKSAPSSVSPVTNNQISTVKFSMPRTTSPKLGSAIEAAIKPIWNTTYSASELPTVEPKPMTPKPTKSYTEPKRNTSYPDLGFVEPKTSYSDSGLAAVLPTGPIRKTSYSDLGSVFERLTVESIQKTTSPDSGLAVEHPAGPIRKTSYSGFGTTTFAGQKTSYSNLGSTRLAESYPEVALPTDLDSVVDTDLPPDYSSIVEVEVPTDLGPADIERPNTNPFLQRAPQNPSLSSTHGNYYLPSATHSSLPSFAQSWSPSTSGTMPGPSYSSIPDDSGFTESFKFQSQPFQPQSQPWSPTLGTTPDSSSSSILGNNTLTLNPNERLYHLATFGTWRPVNGLLSESGIRYILMQSNLPFNIQEQIWNLSNIRKTSSFNVIEFVILLHLIYRTTWGASLPTAISPALYSAAAGVPTINSSNGEIISPVSLDSKIVFDRIFDTLDAAQTGLISGPVAVRYFAFSMLPQYYLAHIWRLVDVSHRGSLTRQEFAIFMYLIQRVRVLGQSLPQRLPLNPLIPSPSRLY